MERDQFDGDLTLSAEARIKLQESGWDGSTPAQRDVENAIQCLREHNLPVGAPTIRLLGRMLGARVFGETFKTFRGNKQWWQISFDVQDITDSTNTNTALYLVGGTLGEIVFPVAAVYGCLDAALYLGMGGRAYVYNMMDEESILVFDSFGCAVDQVVLNRHLSRTIPVVDPEGPFEWSESELALAGLRRDLASGRVVSRDHK